VQEMETMYFYLKTIKYITLDKLQEIQMGLHSSLMERPRYMRLHWLGMNQSAMIKRHHKETAFSTQKRKEKKENKKFISHTCSYLIRNQVNMLD
jgi:hypothetical protein